MHTHPTGILDGGFAFASDAKIPASIERTQPGTGHERPASDNAEFCCLRSCDSCHTSYTPKSTTQRFCSHACYADSIRQPITERFWSKVRQTSTCWIWLGATTGSSVRHGQVMWRGRYRTPQKAHRIAWELTHGPIPADRQINHHCDNPICVNPAHLYLGTQRDNMRDASVRGRFTVPRTRVLSLFDRLTIYHSPRTLGSGVALARRFGVTEAAISVIRRGRFIGSGVWFGTTAPVQQQRRFA